VLDMIGGDYFARNIDVLAVEGRLVEIATLQGVKAEVNIQTIMGRRLTITGSTLRPRSVADKAAIATELRQQVWPLLDSGRVKPVIHARFPLRDAAQAHRVMESSAHIGKLLLTT
jgi:NADPH2:quinone reductase